MDVLEALGYASLRLEEAGLEHPEREAAALLEELLGVSRSGLLLNRTRTLSADERARFRTWLERRAAREPLQHVVGVAHFYGLTLVVSPDVLVETIRGTGYGAELPVADRTAMDEQAARDAATAAEFAELRLPGAGIPRLQSGIQLVTDELRMFAVIDPDGSLIRCLGA